MSIAQQFTGMGVALVTPFTPEGKVDYASLESLLNHLLENEATDFVVVHGTTGESPCLTREERNDVTRLVVNHISGRCPIVVGLGGNDTLELGKRFEEAPIEGIDGFLSVVPYYNKPSQEGLYRHFSHIASRSALPIILYNVPGRVGVNMMPDTIIRLAKDCPNIVGVKEASGYVMQAEQVIQAGLGDNFVVLSGDDALSVPFIQNGARGVISVVGNAYPRLFSELIHLAMDGKYNEADMIQTALRDINTQLFANGNPAGIKALLYQLGIIRHNILRLPLVPTTNEVYNALARAHQRLLEFARSRGTLQL